MKPIVLKKGPRKVIVPLILNAEENRRRLAERGSRFRPVWRVYIETSGGKDAYSVEGMGLKCKGLQPTYQIKGIGAPWIKEDFKCWFETHDEVTVFPTFDNYDESEEDSK